jgi:hypothetical protein
MAPATPAGFETVREHLGAGKTCVVRLVRRVEDGALFALKVPRADDPATRALLEELIERSRVLTRLGLAPGELRRDPTGRVLLQPFVEGPSLRSLLAETDLLTDAADPRLRDLAALFSRIVRARLCVSGLNSENLIFDGERFRIIDCGVIHRMVSGHGAWRRQREKLARHWVRFDGHGAATIEAFLDRLEASLDQPRASLAARVAYRLFRR